MIPRILGQQERIILELFSGLSRLRNGSKLNILGPGSQRWVGYTGDDGGVGGRLTSGDSLDGCITTCFG